MHKIDHVIDRISTQIVDTKTNLKFHVIFRIKLNMIFTNNFWSTSSTNSEIGPQNLFPKSYSGTTTLNLILKLPYRNIEKSSFGFH